MLGQCSSIHKKHALLLSMLQRTVAFSTMAKKRYGFTSQTEASVMKSCGIPINQDFPSKRIQVAECGNIPPTLHRTLPMLQNSAKYQHLATSNCVRSSPSAPWMAVLRPMANGLNSTTLEQPQSTSTVGQSSMEWGTLRILIPAPSSSTVLKEAR
ncbi:MAG: Uncharacterised protein [Candidatus Poseidoniaceae archaeon]|nr:MAG: Uncharacterised protein [Candidatus Poseidoniaceae archaeon]